MLLALAILTISLCVCGAEKTIFTKSYKFPENVVKQSRHGINTLIYTRYNVSQSNSTKRCIVTMISGAFDESSAVTRQCEVSLKPEMPDGKVTDGCRAYGIGSAKVTVIWVEAQQAQQSENHMKSVIIKAQMVDMSRNCHSVHTTMRKYQVQDANPMPIYCFYPRVVVFDDTYEVLLVKAIDKCEPKHKACNYVLYKFDDEGRQISGPGSWPNTLSDDSCAAWYNVQSAEFNRPNKGYFIAEPHRITLAAKLTAGQSNGRKKLQTWSKTFDKSLIKYGYSLANDVIGLCELFKNSSLVCRQYDRQGHIHLETLLKFERSSLLLGHVYNLRNGGVLVEIFTSPDGEYLIEIDKQGVTKAVKVELEFVRPIEYSYASKIFENKKGHYCKAELITEVHTNIKVAGTTVDIYVRCYSPDEFSKAVQEFRL